MDFLSSWSNHKSYVPPPWKNGNKNKVMAMNDGHQFLHLNMSWDHLLEFLVFEKENVWMQGLITKERKGLDPAAAPFAKDPREIEGLREGASLVEVVYLTG
jgi:hypothetical protein